MVRIWQSDVRFGRQMVASTPFRDDVARVYFRGDERIVIQYRGTFRPFAVSVDSPIDRTLRFASAILDEWDTVKCAAWNAALWRSTILWSGCL